MSRIYENVSNCCIALKKNNSRCTFKKKKNSQYCGIHQNTIIKSKINRLNKFTIVRIQSIIRGSLVRNNIFNRGIAVYCRHICNNTTDCYTFDNINKIENSMFVSYKDHNLKYWGFHIDTIEALFKNNMINPYNLDKLPDNLSNNLYKIKKNEHNEHNEHIDNEINIELLCTQIFQKMDNLNNYTKCEWFLDLSLNKLKKLYRELEDLWNYRLNLTHEQKYKYVSNGTLFDKSLDEINNIKNKDVLSKIILKEFMRMVTEGKSNSDKATASQWILGSLTLVNQDACNTLPWLYSSFMVSNY